MIEQFRGNPAAREVLVEHFLGLMWQLKVRVDMCEVELLARSKQLAAFVARLLGNEKSRPCK